MTKFAGVTSASRPVVVLGSFARQDADLVEGAGVDESVDALADGELPGVVLTGDLLLAAHLPRPARRRRSARRARAARASRSRAGRVVATGCGGPRLGPAR